MTKDEIFAEATSVYDNYVEAMETWDVRSLAGLYAKSKCRSTAKVAGVLANGARLAFTALNQSCSARNYSTTSPSTRNFPTTTLTRAPGFTT